MQHPMAQVLHVHFRSKSQTEMQMLIKFLGLLRCKLPSMPHKHIVDVLFSPPHESLLLVSGTQLLAGLAFCEIYGEGIIELCLMASAEPSRGFGGQLVSHLKGKAGLSRVWRRRGAWQ
jgi:hypothetical protein